MSRRKINREKERHVIYIGNAKRNFNRKNFTNRLNIIYILPRN